MNRYKKNQHSLSPSLNEKLTAQSTLSSIEIRLLSAKRTNSNSLKSNAYYYIASVALQPPIVFKYYKLTTSI